MYMRFKDIFSIIWYILMCLLGIPMIITKIMMPPTEQGQAVSIMVFSLSYILTFFLFMVFYYKEIPFNDKTKDFFKRKWWTIPLLHGILTLFNGLIGTYIYGGGTSQNQELLTQLIGNTTTLLPMLVIGVVGPMVEEFIYRHLLVTRLGDRFTRVPRYVWYSLSGLLFIGIHILTDPHTFLLYLPITLIILGLYKVSDESIYVTMGFHVYNNIVAILIMLITGYY